MLKEILAIISCSQIVYSGYTPVIRNYGTLNPYFNQTSYGYFKQIKGDNELGQQLPTVWMQDDLDKRLRIDAGQRGEAGFIAEFYFFKNGSYELNPNPNGDGNFVCTFTPDFNYFTEISTYGEPNFGFLGRHVLEEYDNVTADVYVGQAVDGVGQLNCLFYCDSETCTQFLGLVVVGSANQFSYLEYWYGDNLTNEIPPDSWYQLPEECTNNPKVAYYFQTHYSNGSLITNCPNGGNNDLSNFSVFIFLSLLYFMLKIVTND